MRPTDIIANAAHEYSDTLPTESADRALLVSRRRGFADAAVKALYSNGYVIVRGELLDGLSISADECSELGAGDPKDER